MRRWRGRAAPGDVGVSYLTGKRSRRAAARAEHRHRLARRVVRGSCSRSRPGSSSGSCPRLHATQTPIRDIAERGGARQLRQRPAPTAATRCLVVAEVGLALVLLVSAGLLLRSFAALTQVPPGFNAANLLVVNLPLSPQKYRRRPGPNLGRREDRRPACRTLAGRGERRDDDDAADGGGGIDDSLQPRRVSAERTGRLRPGRIQSRDAGYLSTLGVPLQRGRMLTDARSARRACESSSSTSRWRVSTFRIAMRSDSGFSSAPSRRPDFRRWRSSAIVGDMKQSFEAGVERGDVRAVRRSIPDPILAGMYLNTRWSSARPADPLDIVRSVRAAILEIDPGQPLVNVRTMEAAMAGTVAQPRFQMTLLMIFASIAVALAAVGVYGVMAYTVSQRTPEIGVRMAVGASPNQVIAMVVWQGARLAVMGVVLGLIAAALAAGAMQAWLFDVKGLDPVTFALAPIVLGLAALLASYIPARRAARISPLAALGR